MRCEEFEIVGVDAGRDFTLSESVRRQASEHAQACGKCGALRDSWEEAKAELAMLRDFTRVQQAPPRVKLRLLQELQTKHHSVGAQRALLVAAWALAAAAVLTCALSLQSWRVSHRSANGSNKSSVVGKPARGLGNELNEGTGVLQAVATTSAPANLIADADGDFTPLPGGIWQESDEGAILSVGMQRATLGAFGFPVIEERAADWIQVDLLVAADGSPQAVRFHR